MTISGWDHTSGVQGDEVTSVPADPSQARTCKSFTRFHPQEFFGEAWHAHVPTPEDWERTRVCGEGNPMTRPQDGTGEVFIERREGGGDLWRAAWMCVDERDVLIASELGPDAATLVQCIAWAVHDAKPARVSINLLT